MLVGLFSNLIVFPPTIIMVFLFKRGRAWTKRTNRIDITMERAKMNGKLSWELDGFKREAPKEKNL